MRIEEEDICEDCGAFEDDCICGDCSNCGGSGGGPLPFQCLSCNGTGMVETRRQREARAIDEEARGEMAMDRMREEGY